MAFLFPYDFLGIIGGYMFFICPYFQATFCQQHTAQNSYLLCIWLAVCQEINIRNHFTEIYLLRDKGRQSFLSAWQSGDWCHDTELSRVTRDCCWSHYKAAAPVSPPTQSPPAPATTASPCSVLITCKIFLDSSKIFNVFQGISNQGCEPCRCPHTGRHDHPRGERRRVRPQQPR